MSAQSGCDVLLVVVDREERSSLAVALQDEGHRVTVTAGFAEARQQLEKHPPGVVISDIRLGDFNGLHLALLASNLPTTASIVLDDHRDPMLESQAREFQAVYLVKPIDTIELITHISRFLRCLTPHTMTDLKAFPATCPNGHEVRPAFTVDELKAGQVEGTLQFHCAQCDTDWKPTAKEHAHLRQWLEENST